MKEERNETAALIAGLLGGLLIFISSFIGWVKQEDYFYGFYEEVSTSSTFSAFLLMLGLALWVGVLLAYLWRERLAGGVFCVIVAGALCLTGFTFAIIHIVNTGSEGSDIVGGGAYLGLAGGLFGLLSGLLFLASRKSNGNR